jgi:hypothetical protein
MEGSRIQLHLDKTGNCMTIGGNTRQSCGYMITWELSKEQEVASSIVTAQKQDFEVCKVGGVHFHFCLVLFAFLSVRLSC